MAAKRREPKAWLRGVGNHPEGVGERPQQDGERRACTSVDPVTIFLE